jgi:hypothetical protein
VGSPRYPSRSGPKPSIRSRRSRKKYGSMAVARRSTRSHASGRIRAWRAVVIRPSVEASDRRRNCPPLLPQTAPSLAAPAGPFVQRASKRRSESDRASSSERNQPAGYAERSSWARSRSPSSRDGRCSV